MPRGVSLSPDIPGTSTFAKPSDEPSRSPDTKDESIYRIDNPDDLGKSQSRGDEIDHSEARPSYNGLGESDTSKTKYPYRDNVPSAHNASDTAAEVAQLWLLRTAHEALIPIAALDKVAAKMFEIEKGLNPLVMDRSKGCTVTLKRADPSNMRWIFAVNAGNGVKMVRLKATRKGNVVALAKMDVVFSCSCPAWQWLGPEFHAKSETYLDGNPRGTASTPNIKDPTRINRVCKHVAAVLGTVRKWEVPLRRSTKTAEMIREVMEQPTPER